VEVLLGNGDGTFQDFNRFATVSEPVSVTVADVNGDGHPDLITVNEIQYGCACVFLGNGDGTFQSAVNFGVGHDPDSVAVADVNGDGRPDLVVANYSSNTASVLLGNGDGTFKAAQNFAVGNNPFFVAMADVNGDGRPDLVTANYGSNSVSVLLGNGNGTFQAAQNFAAGSGPLSVAVADLNGDGIPDLVAANEGTHTSSSNAVSVLLGIRNAATHFTVKAPASATAGKSFTITVTALTAGNQLDAVYTGTVHFTSSDGSAVLPADYTFKLTDAGSHKFKVTLNATGSQTITATDKNTSSITGHATVTVNVAAPPPAPSRSFGGGDSAGVDASVAATLLSIPVTLPADYPFMNRDIATYPVAAAVTTVGSPTIPATETARRANATPTWPVHAAVWTAQGGQPFDPEGDLLNPAAIEAFFAHNGFAASRKNI
jgi:hypothetical protein